MILCYTVQIQIEMSSYLQSTNKDNFPVWIDQDKTFGTRVAKSNF